MLKHVSHVAEVDRIKGPVTPQVSVTHSASCCQEIGLFGKVVSLHHSANSHASNPYSRRLSSDHLCKGYNLCPFSVCLLQLISTTGPNEWAAEALPMV